MGRREKESESQTVYVCLSLCPQRAGTELRKGTPPACGHNHASPPSRGHQSELGQSGLQRTGKTDMATQQGLNTDPQTVFPLESQFIQHVPHPRSSHCMASVFPGCCPSLSSIMAINHLYHQAQAPEAVSLPLFLSVIIHSPIKEPVISI